MIVTALRELGEDPSFVNGGVIAGLGPQLGLRRGRALRRRGRRVGRLLPALRHRRRAHHERRRRPPRPLRHAGGVRGRLRAVRRRGERVRRHLERRPGRPRGLGAARPGEGAHLRVRRGFRRAAASRSRPRVRSRSSSSTSARRYSAQLAGAGRAQRPERRRRLRGARRSRPRPRARARRALEAFAGTGRRFELHGTVRGVRVYDDYAHHPTEVAAALATARSVVGEGRVIAVHQPHLYSRTRMMAGDFAAVLRGARRPHGRARRLRRPRGPGARGHGRARRRALHRPVARRLPAGLAEPRPTGSASSPVRATSS